ncbi:MAG: YhjD/YihY/BrkB family envelope integrity protein [Actinomycetota bacterium]
MRRTMAVMQRFSEDGGNNMAAAVAYYGFLSLFPLLLLALSFIGFALAGDIRGQSEWVERLSEGIPGLGQIVGQNIRAVVEARGAVGLIALAGLAWTGAGIVTAAGTALNRIFRVHGYESFVKQNVWRFGTLAALGSLGLLSVAITGSVTAIEASGLLSVLLGVAAVLVGLVLDFGLFMLSYRLLTQRRGPPFGKLWAGAAFAAVGWTVLKVAGSWYATRVVTGATAVYGTFAAVVGVLVLMHLAARVLLYGAEINAVLIEEREGKGGGPMRDRSTDVPAAAGDGERAPGSRSTPDLIVSIASDSATLVRKEIELAKQEVAESVTSRVKAIAVLGVAGVFGLFALGWLSAALARGLDLVLDPWASRLVVGGLFLLLAGAAFVFGKPKAKPPLGETKRTIKEDVRWAKAQLKR